MLRYRAKAGTGRGPQRRLRLGDLGGLALDIASLGLADFEAPPSLTLGAARDVAKVLLGLGPKGLAPPRPTHHGRPTAPEAEAEAKRRKAEGTVSFGALLDRFLEARRESVRPATLALWQSLARAEVRPAFGDRDPREISRADVKAFHRAIGETGRRTWANRALELLTAVFKWATEDEMLPSSPVVNITAFEEHSRDRVLSSDELKAVWEALAFEPMGDPFRLLLWTAARRGEVLGATWAEVDFRAEAWRLPAERTKTATARTIPLSAPALALLQASNT